MIGQGRVRVLTRIEGRTPALPVEAQVLEDDWLKHCCTKHHSQHSKKRVKLTTACHRKEKEKKEPNLDKFSSQQLCWRTLVPAIYADKNRCSKPGNGGSILWLREATLLASFQHKLMQLRERRFLSLRLQRTTLPKALIESRRTVWRAV
jgi:hypothetical protein